MSDISRLRQVRPARPQLPVSWYFDPQIFEQEKKLLFDAGANYIGHELMVPNVADYYTLAWDDHARMLVRNGKDAPTGVQLLSHPSRHPHPIILHSRPNTKPIVCPLTPS